MSTTSIPVFEFTTKEVEQIGQMAIASGLVAAAEYVCTIRPGISRAGAKTTARGAIAWVQADESVEDEAQQTPPITWVMQVDGGYEVVVPQCGFEPDGTIWANVGIGKAGELLSPYNRIRIFPGGEVVCDLGRPRLGKCGSTQMSDNQFVRFIHSHLLVIRAHIIKLCDFVCEE